MPQKAATADLFALLASPLAGHGALQDRRERAALVPGGAFAKGFGATLAGAPTAARTKTGPVSARTGRREAVRLERAAKGRHWRPVGARAGKNNQLF